MKAITITDITNAYAEEAGITKTAAKARVQDVLRHVGYAIIECAEEDTKVFLNGFGTFRTTIKPAHTMTSNLTGETHEVPEKTVVKFKPAVSLYVEVNGL